MASGSSSVPPLTPGTNQKLNATLKNLYKGFNETRVARNIPRDPRDWASADVREWLLWAIRDFSLPNLCPDRLAGLSGRQLVEGGKERFMELTPPFVGDILWEHLDEMIHKDPPSTNPASDPGAVWGLPTPNVSNAVASAGSSGQFSPDSSSSVSSRNSSCGYSAPPPDHKPPPLLHQTLPPPLQHSQASYPQLDDPAFLPPGYDHSGLFLDKYASSQPPHASAPASSLHLHLYLNGTSCLPLLPPCRYGKVGSPER